MNVQLQARRSFTEAELWAIIFVRYENFHHFDRPVNSFAEIAEKLSLKEGTVACICKRFK